MELAWGRLRGMGSKGLGESGDKGMGWVYGWVYGFTDGRILGLNWFKEFNVSGIMGLRFCVGEPP